MDFFSKNVPQVRIRTQLYVFYFNLITQWTLLAAIVTLPNILPVIRVWLQQHFWYFQLALVGPLATFFWSFHYYALIYFNWICGCLLFVSWEAYVKEFVVAQFVYTVVLGLIIQQLSSFYKEPLLGYTNSIINVTVSIGVALIIEFTWTRYEWILIVGMILCGSIFLGYVDRYVHQMIMTKGDVKRHVAYIHHLFIISIIRNFVYNKVIENSVEDII